MYTLWHLSSKQPRNYKWTKHKRLHFAHIFHSVCCFCRWLTLDRLHICHSVWGSKRICWVWSHRKSSENVKKALTLPHSLHSCYTVIDFFFTFAILCANIVDLVSFFAIVTHTQYKQSTRITYFCHKFHFILYSTQHKIAFNTKLKWMDKLLPNSKQQKAPANVTFNSS